MPYGVVTLLDGLYEHEVRNVWRRLADTFGLHLAAAIPQPHFSYHVAQLYDVPALAQALSHLSAKQAPLAIRTSGIGLFTGAQPVIYIPVVRSLALSRLHEDVCRVTADFATDAHSAYHPDHWMPHITLAQGGMRADILPDVVAFLNEQPFTWQFTVSHLAIITDGQAGAPHDLRQIFPLRG